jgi:hypothetical protein
MLMKQLSSVQTPAPAATPVPIKPVTMLCPVCGQTLTPLAADKGATWGYRLDLRRVGPVKDPPALLVCPNCRFPVFKTDFTDTELTRLRAFLKSAEYAAIPYQSVPYYYVALIKERRLVRLPAGDYDIAHAYLQASWQAEDMNEPALRDAYLGKALVYVQSALKTVKRGDPYFPTLHILNAELRRRLGKFSEAKAILRPLVKDKDFQAAYLKRIIAAEEALVKVEDSSPANSP